MRSATSASRCSAATTRSSARPRRSRASDSASSASRAALSALGENGLAGGERVARLGPRRLRRRGLRQQRLAPRLDALRLAGERFLFGLRFAAGGR